MLLPFPHLYFELHLQSTHDNTKKCGWVSKRKWAREDSLYTNLRSFFTVQWFCSTLWSSTRLVDLYVSLWIIQVICHQMLYITGWLYELTRASWPINCWKWCHSIELSLNQKFHSDGIDQLICMCNSFRYCMQRDKTSILECPVNIYNPREFCTHS